MTAIYASKLYKSSNRKDKIKAALNDPINTELVRQLHDYLDEPDVDKEEDDEEEAKQAKKSSGINIKKSEHSEHKLVNHSGETEEIKPMNEELEEQEEEPKEKEEKKEEEPEVESSVKASLDVIKSIVPIDLILGTLKSNESTAAVDRAEIKDDKEFWIYYNDSVNLNDIMNDVIEMLNAAGYSHLKFNRLARSDNAVVFEILPFQEEIQPMITDTDNIEGVEVGEEEG